MNNDPDARGDREGPSGERPTATLVPLRRTRVWILGGAGAALGILILLDGSHRFIMRRDWRAFAAEQKCLLTGVMAQRDRDGPAIRWSDKATLGTNAHQSLRSAMP